MKLKLLLTSDSHGFIRPTTYQNRDITGDFGVSKLATAFKKEETTGDFNCLLKINNGDFIQGSALATYLNKNHAKSNIQRFNNVFNTIGFDATIVGNHEFNYGFDYLKQFINQDSQVLNANILAENTDQSAFGKPYHIYEQSGMKIGLLGLTTAYIPNWEQPQKIAGLHFESAYKMAKKWVPVIKQEADIVVVCYHGGFERDLTTGEPTEALTGENEGYRILTEIPGIDVLLTGHQHRQIAEIVNGVAVIQPGYRGQFYGKVELTFDKDQSGVKISDKTAELVPTKPFSESKEVTTLIDPLHQETEDFLDQKLGQVTGDFTISDPLVSRIEGSHYIDLINHIQLSATKADLSATAILNDQAKGLPESVTMRDILSNYPFPNTLAVIELTGEQLKDVLEHAATFFDLDDQNEIKINPAFCVPKPQLYNYDMFYPLDYTFDITKPYGQRVSSLTYQKQPVAATDKFKVALSQYRAVGGGNYPHYGADNISYEVSTDMAELIAQYIKENAPIEVPKHFEYKIKKA
ncbi:bifunctional metallophosphatase/5'-nucleotidase [Holzapfeliella sp. JNUCC 80]